MSDYTPYQHIAKPYGCDHMTCFANVELWVDSPPDVITLAGYTYRLDIADRSEARCDSKAEASHD